MCNRFRLTERQAEVMRTCGFDPPYPMDETWPPPREIFPSGKKTPRYGLTFRRVTEGNRPLVPELMEWGFPCPVPSKRDPAVKLTKFVTNARNLSSSMWRPSLINPARRCLVPFSHFAEPHPEGGKGDDGQPRQEWFSVPGEPVACFAGLWRPTERGPAFAFVTTEPNAQVAPMHEKAMPVILPIADRMRWLDGSTEEALALVRPWEGRLNEQVSTPQIQGEDRSRLTA